MVNLNNYIINISFVLRGDSMFIIGFMFAVIILVCVVVAVVTGDVAYFVNQQSLGKNADEEE